MKKHFKDLLLFSIGMLLNITHIFFPKKAIHKAFILFCTPRKGGVLDHQKSFLETHKEKAITIENETIQVYRWHGNSDTILLIHGWESNTYRWKELIQNLKKHQFNIISFDAPAHGNSTGKLLDIITYTKCLQYLISNYKPHHLIGHSIGGMTALYNQHLYPNTDIKKLIILAPPSELSRIMENYKDMLKLSSGVMNGLDKYFKNTFGYHFKEFSIAQFSKKITKYGILIHDRYDQIAPFSEGVNISNNWRNASLHVTENYGHSLANDHVNQLIIDFLVLKEVDIV